MRRRHCPRAHQFRPPAGREESCDRRNPTANSLPTDSPGSGDDNHTEAREGEYAGLGAVSEDDGVALLEDSVLFCGLDRVDEAHVLIVCLGLVRVEVGHAAAVQVDSGADVRVRGEHHNGAARLGDDEAGRIGVGCLDDGRGSGLRAGKRVLSAEPDVGDELLVEDCRLCLLADTSHHGDRFERVRAFGGLARKHHAVGAIDDGVGHIGRLGARRTRVVGHRLEHLSRADNRLTRHVALGDHHLLREEDLLRWDLNAQVATRNHHTVRLSKDGIEVSHALVVLDLGDNANALADDRVGRHKARAHVAHILRLADEGCEDHVDILLYGEG
eukprot:scaffold76769_cov30-Tisochrysis_lutea.AAC.2